MFWQVFIAVLGFVLFVVTMEVLVCLNVYGPFLTKKTGVKEFIASKIGLYILNGFDFKSTMMHPGFIEYPRMPFISKTAFGTFWYLNGKGLIVPFTLEHKLITRHYKAQLKEKKAQEEKRRNLKNLI